MDVSLVLTVIGEDRTGLVENLSAVVDAHGGNWLESRMSHLAGKFAGIVHVQLGAGQVDGLRRALAELEAVGLKVVAEPSESPKGEGIVPSTLELMGADHPGIVHDISRVLADRGVNVEELATECTPAPMSGESLFRATARLHLPRGLTADDLRADLEEIAHSLIVDVTLTEGE